MTIQKTSYLNIRGNPDEQNDFILLDPHGSFGQEFLEAYFKSTPIFEDQRISENWHEFIEIERDRGASELTRALHDELLEQGYRVLSIHSQYPRGLVDAGRHPDHGLAPYVFSLLDKPKLDQLRKLHQLNFEWIISHLEKAHHEASIVLDIHSMASHSPKDPLHLSDLTIYKGQYTRGPFAGERKIDLISECPRGDQLGLASLKDCLERFLTAQAFHTDDIAHNEPYVADPKYTMHHVMTACRGMAIDFPKHLLAKDYSPQKLADFIICRDKVRQIALLLAKALIHSKRHEGQ